MTTWTLIIFILANGNITKLDEQRFESEQQCNLKGAFQAEMLNTDPRVSKMADIRIIYKCFNGEEI